MWVLIAWSVAVHSDLMAVGTELCTIVLHRLSTGKVLRVLAGPGVTPGCIGLQTEGVCFSVDRRQIIAAEFLNGRISWFTVEGAFLKNAGWLALSTDDKGIVLAPNGELIVADKRSVHVFDSECNTIARTLSTPGTAPGQLDAPQLFE